jgi:uncharacterized protein (DUF488 family)
MGDGEVKPVKAAPLVRTAAQGTQGNAVYTIGHSNAPLTKILDLLRQFGVTMLVDARSVPYSSYSHQFDREQLERSMPEGIRYVYLGHELGGRTGSGAAKPGDERIAARLRTGIRKMLRTREHGVVCLMCAEEDPRECHRSRLIATVLLAEYGVDAQHIRHDGQVRVQPESRLEAEQKQQLSLFG